MNLRRFIAWSVAALAVSAGPVFSGDQESTRLPQFGRDTVLVWNAQISNSEASFIVRIAEFSPDRYVEWENEKTQGTVFMPAKDVLEAKGYASSSLFEAGVDRKSKNTTTLWLSRRIYKELKEKKKAKCDLDGVPAWLKFLGEEHLTIEVNRHALELPVIRVADDRGSERWFLDQEDNPLLAKHLVRNYCQTLISITTNKSNTLRWINKAKLAHSSR
jgi:hypothetical protein